MSNVIQFTNKDRAPVYSRGCYHGVPDFSNVVSIKHGDLLRVKKACQEYMTLFGAGIRTNSPIPDMLAFEKKLDYTRYSIEDL